MPSPSRARRLASSSANVSSNSWRCWAVVASVLAPNLQAFRRASSNVMRSILVSLNLSDGQALVEIGAEVSEQMDVIPEQVRVLQHRALQFAPSAYRRHAARQRHSELLCARAQRDAVLMPHIERVWRSNHQIYGADKVWQQLQREGFTVARCTVERLMRRLGLRDVVRGKGLSEFLCSRRLVDLLSIDFSSVFRPLPGRRRRPG